MWYRDLWCHAKLKSEEQSLGLLAFAKPYTGPYFLMMEHLCLRNSRTPPSKLDRQFSEFGLLVNTSSNCICCRLSDYQIVATMSLQDLQQQIETVARKIELESELKGNRAGFSSRVRNGIRKEFSAFKKVLEGSKSRLQELQEMQVTLEEMEEEPALSPTKKHNLSSAKEAMKDKPTVGRKKKRTSPSSRKSPHWLPSLGRKKKFFAEEDDSDDARDEAVNTYRESSDCERDYSNAIDDIIEEDSEGASVDSDASCSKMKNWKGGASRETHPAAAGPKAAGAVRERAFRTSLQARALALSRGRSAAAAKSIDQSTKPAKSSEDDYSGASTAEETDVTTHGPSVAEVAGRLDPIRMIDTTPGSDCGAGVQGEPEGDYPSSPLSLHPPDPPTTPQDPAVSPASSDLCAYNSNSSEILEDTDPEEGSSTKGRSRSSKWGPKFKKTLSLIKGKHSGKPKSGSLETLEEALHENSNSTSESSETAQPTDEEEYGIKVDTGKETLGTVGVAPIRVEKVHSTNKKAELPKPATMVESPKHSQKVETPKPVNKVESPKPMKKVSSRPRSFHTDGWKGSVTEHTATEIMTEESIAAQELIAREAYIKAMQTNQSLLRSGKAEESPEVKLSKELLQECCARVEYWERMQEEINEDRAAAPSSPRSTNMQDTTDNDIGEEAEQSAEQLFNVQLSGDLQDSFYVGEKELKAREAYIFAMRHHQEILAKRVSTESEEWVESQKNQQECLAQLQFWEARLNKTEAETASMSRRQPTVNTSRPRKEQAKNIYRISEENREDRINNAPLIETLFVAARDKIFKPNDLPDNTQPYNQPDGEGVGWTDALCAVVCCTDSNWLRTWASGSGSTHNEANKRRPKTVSKKGSGDRKSSTKGGKHKTSGEPDGLAQASSYFLWTSEGIDAKEAKEAAKADPMRKIESQAKQILGHLNLKSFGSAESSDVVNAFHPKSENETEDILEHLKISVPRDKDNVDDEQRKPTVTETSRQESRASVSNSSKASKVTSEEKSSQRKKKSKPKQHHEDDMSEVSKLIEEVGGGLFCTR